MRSEALTVLFSAIVGALISFVPTLFLTARTERLSRERELWRRDAERCEELEELAGKLTDRLSQWGVRPEEWEPIGTQIGDLARLSGRFPRYPDIQKAIRDLHNTTSRMWADRNHYDSQAEREAVQAELRTRMAILLGACSQALGRK
jgi:hypothetical protein